MTRGEARDELLMIIETVEGVHGNCDKCPYCGIIDNKYKDTYTTETCPFAECPESWEI
ncbi:MAG: hypothetical protein Q4G33_06555 [bacterium]|nr:hypothetical protein [bacterium]